MGGRLGPRSNPLLRVFLAMVDQWRFAKSSGDTEGSSQPRAGREGGGTARRSAQRQFRQGGRCWLRTAVPTGKARLTKHRIPAQSLRTPPRGVGSTTKTEGAIQYPPVASERSQTWRGSHPGTGSSTQNPPCLYQAFCLEH